eukprot:COSAG06_NODE_31390_length_522_cov_1.115839_2_plen_58_part_01
MKRTLRTGRPLSSNLRGVTYILARSRYAYETQSTGNDDAADNLLTLQRRVGNIKRDIG